MQHLKTTRASTVSPYLHCALINTLKPLQPYTTCYGGDAMQAQEATRKRALSEERDQVSGV